MKTKQPDFTKYNKVSLIQGGYEYFALLHQLIQSAKISIHLQVYILEDDTTGRSVINDLIEAATRGVQVFVLIDAYGSQSLPGEIISEMASAGIFIRKFEPLFKSKRFYLGRRLHHKVVVIDGIKATVAGLNISDRYNDLPHQAAWLDWALFVEGDSVHILEEVCRTRLKIRRRFPVVKTNFTRNVCHIGVRVNDWVRRKSQINKCYLQMLDNAEEEIIIMSAYFLPGRQFRIKLRQARKRGVKIKIVVTGDSDVFLIKYAERYIYKWLLRNNIEVFEYAKNVLHGKIAVCDQKWMTVGSYNINNLSAFASVELNLEVANKAFGLHVHERLSKIIAQDCVKITDEIFFRKHNFLVRGLHKMAYALFRFLFFISTRQRDR